MAGRKPIAMVRMDNCSHNGEKLRNSLLQIARSWLEKGLIDNDFLTYVEDEKRVFFPWSMIDKITPRPSDAVCRDLQQLGISYIEPIAAKKGTFSAESTNRSGYRILWSP